TVTAPRCGAVPGHRRALHHSKGHYFTAILLASLCISIAGCSSSPIAALEADQTAQDEFPESLSAEVFGIDPDSVRFAATKEGIDFYLAQQGTPNGERGVCVVINVIEDPERATAACSGSVSSVQPLTAGMTGYADAEVVTDDFDTSDLVQEGWEQVHSNLLVQLP
ncbi:hypothetical protein, partial [uncultured Arthrobacter sp.]|uniref:hypothetical protein n=1 Tax=uncultured Arthrobacter sp. TaxID=114050 RepID=UPI0026245580